MPPLSEPSLSAYLARRGTVFLDAGAQAAADHASLLFTTPIAIVESHALEDVERALEAVDAWVEKGKWVAGFIAYEAGFAFVSQRLTKPLSQPLLWFGVYDEPQAFSPEEVGKALGSKGTRLEDLIFSPEKTAYLDALAAIKHHIYEGDVYQINYTGHLDFQVQGAAVDVFAALRQRQTVSFGAFLNMGTQRIMSLSPELFFEREGRTLRTRPMKGTIQRGRTTQEDRALRAQLAADEKNRAENLMIVDLMRNDLSRVCEPGTVQTPHLFTTEPYPTLFQMTSTVEGRLKPETTYTSIFKALFPCGSITGAPKIRAMQIIDAMEEEARGVYCGAIGYIAPHQKAAFSVGIRTLVLNGQEGRMGVGSGIVWDSEPEAEYDECLLKAQFLEPLPGADATFDFIETMLWDDEIALLSLHLDRLEQSALFFGRPFQRAQVEAQIHAVAVGLQGRHKVRLLLHPDGTTSVTTAPLPAASMHVRKLSISEERVDSHNVFFYHKTTRRQFYENAYQQAHAEGFDEVLFLNERDELTEGSRSNLFVRFGGTLYTPPLTAGVLPGVYRRYVLETFPNVEERTLHLSDLVRADAIYITNAVQGWVEGAWMLADEPASTY